MKERLRLEFAAFLRDIVAMIEGRGRTRSVNATHVNGSLRSEQHATFMGGDLAVLSTLIGSRYEHSIRPTRRWLVVEDFNDQRERMDRFLSHLTLARSWEECEGIPLGDFHRGYEDLTAAIAEFRVYHIPGDRSLPLLQSPVIGHVWHVSPVPVHSLLVLEQRAEREYLIRRPEDWLRPNAQRSAPDVPFSEIHERILILF